MKWNLRTLVIALRGHMLTQPNEVGGIRTPIQHRVKLALLSREYHCPHCMSSHRRLLREIQEDADVVDVDRSNVCPTPMTSPNPDPSIALINRISKKHQIGDTLHSKHRPLKSAPYRRRVVTQLVKHKMKYFLTACMLLSALFTLLRQIG